MVEYYDEVKANLTWYELNSEFNDSMYQYLVKLEKELYAKIPKVPFIPSIYNSIDSFTINIRNESLYYGSYECSTPGKNASMDSFFSCFIFQLPFFLERIQIGWIGFAFVIPILLISLFGGIKESYRWFILNQAIWDALLCYDFICAKPTLLGWSKLYVQQSTCFYRDDGFEFATTPFLYIVKLGFRVCLRNASFIPIFHLALSRYIAMYFPGFYKRFTKYGYKILIFIILFTGICIALFSFGFASSGSLFSSAYTDYMKCYEFCPFKNTTYQTYCKENFPKFFQCSNRQTLSAAETFKEQEKHKKIFSYITYSIPPIMFLLSIICAGALLYKISSQLKFQHKANQESFKQTIKISSVVGFQCLTMSAIFLITGIQKFMQIKRQITDKFSVYDELPTWLLLLQYYTTTASLNMIRIILDSCIILTVLTGYSRCVVSFFKFLWLLLRNPKNAFNIIKQNVTSTKVTIIRISQK